MVQGGYVYSRIPGAEATGSGTTTDIAIFAMGGGLGLVAGLLRPLGKTFLGSLVFGVILVEVGVWGLWRFVRQGSGTPELTTLAASGGLGSCSGPHSICLDCMSGVAFEGVGGRRLSRKCSRQAGEGQRSARGRRSQWPSSGSVDSCGRRHDGLQPICISLDRRTRPEVPWSA
jgi:hypothetical protein